MTESKEEIDSFLASSMAELSFGDRQKYQEELHGVVNTKPEDSEQISAWIQDMQTYLKELSTKGSAYQTAETMDWDYVHDYKFQLMFLRGNRYKPKESAQQILSYFEMKKRLFGAEKLTKEITLQDLDEDDKTILQTGSLRQLPCYDSAGRTILLGLPGLLDVSKLESDLKARFYFFMNVLHRDERAQLKGVVVVSYTLGRFRDTSRGKGFVNQTKLSMALPIHFAGLHLCSDDPLQYLLVSACLRIVPSHLRARFRLHMGSDIECQYGLKAFGIPPEALPPRSDAAFVAHDYHMRWYKECEWREAMAASDGCENLPGLPIEPYPADVLFGGRRNSNGGNRQLRILVRNHANQYDSGTKEQKRDLVEQVMQQIRISGGRFLNLGVGEPEHWVELSAEDACSKVAQAFRNNRRPRVTNGPVASNGEGAGISSQFFGSKQAANRSPDQPSENDVLFGRKRNNEGNKRVRQLVGELSTEYDKASKARKTQLADSVVQEIQKQGGRFLKQTDGDSSKWEEVPDEFARNKISKHFRNNRRPPTTKC
ncbi:unnamed protein product [Cylindrotheca closterium]|uniref:DUF6824 domain-containing protein n=1 Tax=Cylindrotheca closterium TaxID=2856 RepID=A0AAD2GCJ4_9STRA|nr:unnamed protein product [Cylindrotheca closterium]